MNSLGSAEGFNLVVTTLQVCRKHKPVFFPMIMLTETSSAMLLNEGFRWQGAVDSGSFFLCCFRRRSGFAHVELLGCKMAREAAVVIARGDGWYPWIYWYLHTAVQQ